MTSQTAPPRSGAFWVAVLAVGLLAAGAVVYFALPAPRPPALATFEVPQPPEEASAEEVHRFCGACHAYPPPETFPRSAWRKEVRQAYDFFRDSTLQMEAPSLEGVALYYERRAPEALAPLEHVRPATPSPVRWRREGFALPGDNSYPGVTNVNLVKLSDRKKLDVLVCDAHLGQVLALRPHAEPAWQVLGKVTAPAHAEVVDLDRDGF